MIALELAVDRPAVHAEHRTGLSPELYSDPGSEPSIQRASQADRKGC